MMDRFSFEGVPGVLTPQNQQFLISETGMCSICAVVGLVCFSQSTLSAATRWARQNPLQKVNIGCVCRGQGRADSQRQSPVHYVTKEWRRPRTTN